jgi:4-aminobutyrate aminotransferase/(S)-3-amino-2-methylpropionate transaminase
MRATFGEQLPSLRPAAAVSERAERAAADGRTQAPSLPGPRSAALVDSLARTECPAVTARRARRAELSGASHDPVVWVRARGANVEDADGNVFVDLTGGFGAAAVGHAHPAVVAAVQRQSERLMHALGDVYPSDVKIALLERLARLAPFPEARVILGLSGADAVEAALKTAVLTTGKPGVLAFEGGYHGLSYGALSVCGFKQAFRSPFEGQLPRHVSFAPYPAAGEPSGRAAIAAVRECFDRAPVPIGAILVEPALGRGGVVFSPRGFLSDLADIARTRGALLIADEIYTGLGRCGATWLSVAEGVVPDLLVTGKALGGGMPISACIGRAEVMRHWGAPGGEALHTSTYVGHPPACAAALASLEVIEREGLAARAVRVGEPLRDALRARLFRYPSVRAVRGAGLMLGIELDETARSLRVLRGLVERGYLALAAGPDARVISATPPLTITEAQLAGFADALDEAVSEAA